MARGRPRRAGANFPPHVIPDKVPKGIYWDGSGRGRWYALEPAGDGRTRKRRVAGPDARLSDLYLIAEERQGTDRNSLNWLLQQHAESAKFKRLAPRTQQNYRYLAKVIGRTKTRLGLLGELHVRAMSRPFWQRIVELMGEETPTQANQVLRYVRSVFRWGMNRGLCHHNPAEGVEQVPERQRRRRPNDDAYGRVLALAKAGAEKTPHTAGSCSPYLWAALELAYLLRLRGVEVATLTLANATDRGVITNRRKGSKDTLVLWSPRLRAAWDALEKHRDKAIKLHDRPTPMRLEDRQLLVTESGTPLAKSSLDSAFQRLITRAISEGVITQEERFSPHDLKRKGVSDTEGTPGDKQQASGLKSPSMLTVYDLDVPESKTPGGV